MARVALAELGRSLAVATELVLRTSWAEGRLRTGAQAPGWAASSEAGAQRALGRSAGFESPPGGVREAHTDLHVSVKNKPFFIRGLVSRTQHQALRGGFKGGVGPSGAVSTPSPNCRSVFIYPSMKNENSFPSRRGLRCEGHIEAKRRVRASTAYSQRGALGSNFKVVLKAV